MNIILTGYRCTGKSSAGRRLSARLGRPLFDTDDLILHRTGKTVEQIVAAGGWPAFRDAERAVIRNLSLLDGGVIATGGGALMDPRNVAYLRGNGLFVWLMADPATIAGKAGEGPGRRQPAPLPLRQARRGGGAGGPERARAGLPGHRRSEHRHGLPEYRRGCRPDLPAYAVAVAAVAGCGADRAPEGGMRCPETPQACSSGSPRGGNPTARRSAPSSTAARPGSTFPRPISGGSSTGAGRERSRRPAPDARRTGSSSSPASSRGRRRERPSRFSSATGTRTAPPTTASATSSAPATGTSPTRRSTESGTTGAAGAPRAARRPRGSLRARSPGR